MHLAVLYLIFLYLIIIAKIPLLSISSLLLTFRLSRDIMVRKKVDENMRETVEVVAALIWDGNRFMICQRPSHKTRGLLWEFVGGKVEPGETKSQALIRECREELDVTVSVGDVFMEVLHDYPDIKVHLTLFHAAITEGTPKKLEHNDIRWITAEQIPDFDFCPADTVILERLMAQEAKGLSH